MSEEMTQLELAWDHVRENAFDFIDDTYSEPGRDKDLVEQLGKIYEASVTGGDVAELVKELVEEDVQWAANNRSGACSWL